jgi:hypothetical protein
MSKPMGSTGHYPYVNVQDGGEFFAIDLWDNLEGIQKLYSDPSLASELGKMFEGQPEVTIWTNTGWFQY